MISAQARLPLDDLAAANRALSGDLTSDSLDSRLANALGVDKPEGTVSYRLNFNRDLRDGIYVTGRIQARLLALCQRCLCHYDLNLKIPVHLLIPYEGTPMADQPGWDVTEPGVRPTLSELIADELLLAMPSVPRHPEGACSQPGVSGSHS